MTRPPSFTRRVGEAMRNLLAMKPQGSLSGAMTQAGDPMRVGVVARLGLLRAVASDAAVLIGGMKRGTAEDQAARLDLLQRAASSAISVDVRLPLALPVRCGGKVHVLELEADGTVVSLAHPGVDVQSERVATSLGSPMLPCVRELIAAGRPCPRPSADTGRRDEPIAAGELLAFVLTCRSWLDRGFTLADCSLAVDQGLTHGQVQAHLDAGLDLPSAAAWAFMPAAEAVRWIAVEFGPSEVQTWLSQGRTLAEAEDAVRNSGSGRWLARWARVAGRSVQSEALAAWAAMGLPVGVWGDVASRGVRAEDALTWLAEGFTSVEILRYAHLRVGLAEALTWRDEGFTAFVAAGCLGVGMTLADAVALRGLPTREVQDAWKRSQSVSTVRAEVEALIAEDPRGRVGER